jgi:hypothetical protein
VDSLLCVRGHAEASPAVKNWPTKIESAMTTPWVRKLFPLWYQSLQK